MANTLLLAVAATVIGCLIGLLCGILNTIPYTKHGSPCVKRFFLKLIRVVVRIYVEVFRGTPMVLQAVFIYYGLPYFTNEQVMFRGNGGLWLAAIIVVSINTGAYMAETVRGGILSIDPGQTEGAKAIGMTHVQTMTSVILPQAFRNILPQIGNNFIINIKDTSVMFIIGFVEFFGAHRNIVGNNYMYFQSAAIEMLGYLYHDAGLPPSCCGRVERLLDGAVQLRAGPDRPPQGHGCRHLPPPQEGPRAGGPQPGVPGAAEKRGAGAPTPGTQARTEQGGTLR